MLRQQDGRSPSRTGRANPPGRQRSGSHSLPARTSTSKETASAGLAFPTRRVGRDDRDRRRAAPQAGTQNRVAAHNSHAGVHILFQLQDRPRRPPPLHLQLQRSRCLSHGAARQRVPESSGPDRRHRHRAARPAAPLLACPDRRCRRLAVPVSSAGAAPTPAPIAAAAAARRRRARQQQQAPLRSGSAASGARGRRPPSSPRGPPAGWKVVGVVATAQLRREVRDRARRRGRRNAGRARRVPVRARAAAAPSGGHGQGRGAGGAGGGGGCVDVGACVVVSDRRAPTPPVRRWYPRPRPRGATKPACAARSRGDPWFVQSWVRCLSSLHCAVSGFL